MALLLYCLKSFSILYVKPRIGGLLQLMKIEVMYQD